MKGLIREIQEKGMEGSAVKPLQITMSAFGSYAGEATVDFERADHGFS